MFFWWSRNSFFSQSNTCQAGSHWAFPWRRATLEVKIPWKLWRIPLRRLRLRVCRATTRLWRISNEDKTTVTLTIQAPKRRTVCCSFDIYPEDKGSKWKLWWEKFFEIPLVFQSEMTVSSHFSSPLDGHIPKLSGKTNFKFPKSVWEDNFYRRRFPQLYGKTDFKVQCHSAHKPLTERIDRIEKWFLAKPHLCARYRYLRSWVDVIDLMILLFVLLSHARSEVRCCMLEAANLSVAILSDDFRFLETRQAKHINL